MLDRKLKTTEEYHNWCATTSIIIVVRVIVYRVHLTYDPVVAYFRLDVEYCLNLSLCINR